MRTTLPFVLASGWNDVVTLGQKTTKGFFHVNVKRHVTEKSTRLRGIATAEAGLAVAHRKVGEKERDREPLDARFRGKCWISEKCGHHARGFHTRF